jgi:hypothetical protein
MGNTQATVMYSSLQLFKVRYVWLANQ